MTEMPSGWEAPNFYKLVREWRVRQKAAIPSEAKLLSSVIQAVYKGTHILPYRPEPCVYDKLLHASPQTLNVTCPNQHTAEEGEQSNDRMSRPGTDAHTADSNSGDGMRSKSASEQEIASPV